MQCVKEIMSGNLPCPISSLHNTISNLELFSLEFLNKHAAQMFKNYTSSSYQIHFPATQGSSKKSFWSVSVKNSASWYSFRLELENNKIALSVNRINIKQDKASKYAKIDIDKKTTWLEALERLSALWISTPTPVTIWLNSDEHI